MPNLRYQYYFDTCLEEPRKTLRMVSLLTEIRIQNLPIKKQGCLSTRHVTFGISWLQDWT
jgi:hypothetical protein